MTTLETFNLATQRLATITRPLLSHPQAAEIGIDVLEWIQATRAELLRVDGRARNSVLDEALNSGDGSYKP